MMQHRLGRSLVIGLLTTATTVVGDSTSTTAAVPDVASQTCSPSAGDPFDPPAPLDGFEPVRPTRLVDTRDGTGGVDFPVGAGCVLELDLTTTDVPATAEAVALSVTAIAPQRGFLTVFPCAAGQPATSNLNARGSDIPTPNLVVATLDADGTVCIFSQLESDLIVDLTGWWIPGGDTRLVTMTPTRADDSRNDPGRPLVAARTERVIDLSGLVPDGTRAVVGNLTITEPVAGGFATAYPCGEDLPLASNLNYVAGESRAVAVAVGIDDAERLCVQANVDAHVIFDLAGYYEAVPQFGPISGLQPLPGERLADSRNGDGGWDGKFDPGTTRTLRPTADRPNHSQSSAAVVNVVVTEAEADGFLTIYPCDEDQPTTSVVNYTPAGESTNLVVVDLAANGDICVFSSQRAHVVVDLFGALAADDDVFVEHLELDAFTWPGYSPEGTDYVTECGASTDIDLGLLRGVTARVNGVPVVSGRIDLPTSPDDRIRVELRRGGVTQQHSFRCVRDDFPRLDVEFPASPDTPAVGWYLTTMREPGSGVGYVVVLDHRGAPVWYKRVVGDLIDVQRRSDGRLVLVRSLGPRYGVDVDRGYVTATMFGTVIDELTAKPIPSGLDPDLEDLVGLPMPADHHDYVEVPGGGYALIVYTIFPADLSALGAGYSATDEISENVIQEIAADGSLTWAWQTGDHFGVEVPFPQRWGPIDGYPGTEVDIYHLNSLDRVDDGSGDYVASARHMDNVFRVDRATGDIDWVLGPVPSDSPAATLAAELTIVDDPLGGPLRPHDARLDGNVLTMFDNRTATSGPARAVAYEIDETAGTATLLWSIDEPEGRPSAALGSNRSTEDGTITISWGAGIQPVFGEYSADGDPLIEITQIEGGNAYRFVKLPADTYSASFLRATAGGDVDLP